MKNLPTYVLAASLAFAGAAQAQTQQIGGSSDSILSSANVQLGWSSQYVWRGLALSAETFHPEVNVGFFDDSLSFGFWAALPQDNGVKPGKAANFNQFNEYNYVAAYNGSLGPIFYSLGGTAYVFRTSNAAFTDGEIYEGFLSASYLLNLTDSQAVTLSATYSREFHKSFGGAKLDYIEGQAEYSMLLGRATLSAVGFLGYISRTDYTYGGVEAKVSYPLDASGRLVANASVLRTEPIDNQPNKDIDTFIVRLGVSLSL